MDSLTMKKNPLIMIIQMKKTFSSGCKKPRDQEILNTRNHNKPLSNSHWRIKQNKGTNRGHKRKQAALTALSACLHVQPVLLACLLCFVLATSTCFSDCVFVVATISTNQTNKADRCNVTL